MNNYELIRNAILNKQQVFAIYETYSRELCPHAIGIKNGRQQALFYQFGGSGSKGPIVPGALSNWRCLPIEGLSNITVQAGKWHTAENHGKAQTCIDDIDIEVTY
jgi:hypothetical protein